MPDEKGGSIEVLYSFFSFKKGKPENVRNINNLIKDKGSKLEKRKRSETHLNVTLNLAYYWMFWLVSGKRQKRSFCPDDEWGELTGHFSLCYSLSLLPSFLSSSSYLLTPPTNPKPQFVPSDCGPETNSTR